MCLIDNWKAELRRLWSIRLSFFFGAVNGIALGLAAFYDVLNPWLFMGLNVVVYMLLFPLARLWKQEPKA
jgi:galactitol-specific phosphotransferase system IIC component